MRPARTRASDAQTLWFGAVLVVLAGYVFVFRADEARIADRGADTQRIVARLADGERTLRARESLERERTLLRERLRPVDLADDRTAVVARFVREAARIAARHRTRITAITADGGTRSPLALAAAPVASASASPRTGDGTRPDDDAFDTIALSLTVEGRYRDVLATIAALSTARVLAEVDVTSLARKQAGSADPTLSAQVRVAIERLAPTAVPGARARPA